MPESLTTLPPEIVFKVFRSVDQPSTATGLSQTCRLMHDVWLANRDTLSMALVPKHRILHWQPNRRLKPLWGHALEYETTRRDYNPTQDGFVAAKRILDTARMVRRTASDVYKLIMDYSDAMYHPGGEEHTGCFEIFAPPIIARTLYTLLTRLEHHQPVDTAPNVLYAVCRFVANHSPTLPWNDDAVISAGFPYLGKLLHSEEVSPDQKCAIQEYEFTDLIYRIAEEYEPVIGFR